jgi:hypothetical protein
MIPPSLNVMTFELRRSGHFSSQDGADAAGELPLRELGDPEIGLGVLDARLSA